MRGRWDSIFAALLILVIGLGLGYLAGLHRGRLEVHGVKRGVIDASQPPASPERTTARAAPETATPPSWHEVAEWRGKGSKTTDTFTVGPKWKIQWETTVVPPMPAGNFVIEVHPMDGRRSQMVANVLYADRDESVQHEGGTYYLEITSLQSYEVKVLEYR